MPNVSPAVSKSGGVPYAWQPPSDQEHEFIRGNRDGPDGSNDTYTECRLRVSEERLDEEMKLGLHPHFLTLSQCWNCPAHIYYAAWIQYVKAMLAKQRPTGAKVLAPPTAAPLKAWKASGLAHRSAGTFEIIQQDPDRSAARKTFTVCRAAIPRELVVEEVEAGLHPGYHVRTSSTGQRYVQGNPTRAFDNVDEPKSLKARPGFSSQQLCPYRLLRPGSQLRA